MKKENLICPICNTVQPFEVDFCVYCNTEFDKQNIKKTDAPILQNENEEA